METLKRLFEQNRTWASEVNDRDPDFFKRLAAQQTPKILWIGCADSRVPATEICKMDPGEIFVHRNVANLVIHTDLNSMSVIQYAVEVLKVTDVIVCGHYGCGGVQAALGNNSFGPIDNWLRNIKDTAFSYEKQLSALEGQAKFDRMCELNVVQQVNNLCHSNIIQGAWKAKQDLTVHGIIYSLKDGILKNLDISAAGPDKLAPIYRFS